MDENRATMTVMDKDRRMLHTKLYLSLQRESNWIQSCWTGKSL